MTEKSEEQIDREKAAVASLKGAKSNMAAALERIETLESALRNVRSRCECVGKAFGDTAHFNVYHQTNWQVRSAKDIFGDIDRVIKAVL